jgi:hypothetical protein
VVGTYPINISAGTLAAGNYCFNFVDGVLTVTASTATKLFGTAAWRNRRAGNDDG